MSSDPRLKPLGELQHLGLINSDEYDDTLAELQIIELQRAHNAAEDIDVPELAMTADQVKTLAWLLSTELVPENRFFQMLHKLPVGDQRRQLATAALQQVNREAVDTLYDENVINQWQRDAFHDCLPDDCLTASPVAALRHMLKQGTLSQQDYQTMQTRVRSHGSALARVIVDAAGKPPTRYGRRTARPLHVMLVAATLVMLMVVAVAGQLWFKREQPAPAAQPADTVERTDLQQRAADVVEGARQPGADAPRFEVQVIQGKAPPPRP